MLPMVLTRRLCRPAPSTRAARPLVVLGLAARRHAGQVVVTATVDRPGPWYLYWFIDGEYSARTNAATLTLARPTTCTVDVIASRHGHIDPQRWQWPSRSRRWTLFWVRPNGPVDHYRLEWVTGQSGGTWTPFATISDTGAWSYRTQTPELEDDEWYRFRVVPVRNNNDGTATQWAARRSVRAPDGPLWTLSYDPQTQRVTFEQGS